MTFFFPYSCSSDHTASDYMLKYIFATTATLFRKAITCDFYNFHIFLAFASIIFKLGEYYWSNIDNVSINTEILLI